MPFVLSIAKTRSKHGIWEGIFHFPSLAEISGVLDLHAEKACSHLLSLTDIKPVVSVICKMFLGLYDQCTFVYTAHCLFHIVLFDF